MPRPRIQNTWDGKPISEEPPFGASVIVYRLVDGQHQFLILHRSLEGVDYQGDWAWTPPSGARYPGEPILQCARRELHEETGLRLSLQRVANAAADWPVYLAEATSDQAIRLSPEHDRFAWVTLDEAMRRCRPVIVAHPFSAVAEQLGILS